MKNVSTKELNYVNDFLSWELLTAKKCFQYAKQEEEAGTGHQQIFYDAAQIHQQNYSGLLNYISQLGSQQGGQMH